MYTKLMVKLTQVQNPFLKTCLTLRKLAYSDYVKACWERLVIGIYDKAALVIRRLHTDKPRGSGRVIGFRLDDPVEEIREEIMKFFINNRVGVGRPEFKSSILHNTKARLFHSCESNGRYVDIGLEAIDRVER
jgi:hypothetical protein